MTGIDKARKIADKLRGESKEKTVKDEQAVVKIEHSKDVAPVARTGGVQGFNELPGSIIRLPYFRMVHPNSRGTELENGERANPGHFLTDMQEERKELRVAIIRTKTDKINQTVKENGKEVTKVKPIIKILAVDTETLVPFLYNLTKGSFYNMGDLMLWFSKMGAKSSFDYPVIMKGEFVETVDNPYWATRFEGQKEKFTDEELDIMREVAMRYSSVLDNSSLDDGEDEEMLARDSQGRPIEDIDLTEDVAGEHDSDKMPF